MYPGVEHKGKYLQRQSQQDGCKSDHQFCCGSWNTNIKLYTQLKSCYWVQLQVVLFCFVFTMAIVSLKKKTILNKHYLAISDWVFGSERKSYGRKRWCGIHICSRPGGCGLQQGTGTVRSDWQLARCSSALCQAGWGGAGRTLLGTGVRQNRWWWNWSPGADWTSSASR